MYNTFNMKHMIMPNYGKFVPIIYSVRAHTGICTWKQHYYTWHCSI